MLHYLRQQERERSLLKSSPSERPEVRLLNVSRRGFLQGTGGAAGLVVAMQLLPTGTAHAFEPYSVGGLDMPHGLVTDPHVFVSIDPDGTVSIVAHRSEMGQGARTSLPMIIADELGADWARVRIIQAPGDEPRYGNQDTDGSRSVRHHIQSMRQIGAAVRHMLVQAAAAEWDVDASEVATGVHEVLHEASGRSLGFGDLALAAMSLEVPPFEDLHFKDESEFRYIGKGEVQIYDLRDITTGAAVYGADVYLPDMKVAVIARPPVVGGTPRSVNSDAALAISGVEHVVELEGSMPPAKFAPLGGVAVVASNTWAAMRGRDALEIEWDDGPHGGYTSESFLAEMEVTARQPGRVLREQGDVDGAFAAAARTFSAQYSTPHLAHIPMEPPVALARVGNGTAEIWAPVQSPHDARVDVAEALGMDPEDVTLHVTLLGGGFGRKSKCDFAIEAALLSQRLGVPIRVQWTREDDVRHCFYHTTSVEHIEIALDADDRPTGWLHRSVAPSILSTFAPDSGLQFGVEHGMGLVDVPFDIANLRCEDGEAMAHTRIGWFRAVSNLPRAFAIQSFAAELAHELGRDQKEFLLQLIGEPRIIDRAAAGFPDDHWNYGDPYEEYPIDAGRLRNVVELATERAGWGRELPEREGMGLAVHRSFLSYVASVVRVRVDDDGTVHVPETHTAIDCGFCANPERVRSQTEGAAVMGMSLALHGITFENGRPLQSNFHDYDVVRSTNFPEVVHTHIVEHPFSVHAAGAGEPPLPPFAPAMLNAIFNATGKRIRALPVRFDDLRRA